MNEKHTLGVERRAVAEQRLGGGGVVILMSVFGQTEIDSSSLVQALIPYH